ncbi:MAG: DNA polymerase III subunit beta [Candidatus Paceibacterota bacterium]|jgi:DNA polymerase-3 subunit beta
MKADCSKDLLAEVLNKLEKIAGKHQTLPVLSGILIEAEKGSLVLKATNLDVAAEFVLPAKVEEAGRTVVPAAALASFATNLSGGKNIRLELSQNNLKLVAPNNTALIKTLPVEEFPSLPEVVSGQIFTLMAKDLVKGLVSVAYSSAGHSLKPELASVSLRGDGESLVFAATDSFRLAEKKIKIKKDLDFNPILVPVKNANEIVRLLEKINGEVEIKIDKNQMAVSAEGLTIITRLVDGLFPDYQQIIPKEKQTEATVLKQDLLNALKLSNIFSGKFNQINFSIKPTSKTFKISSKTAELGENEQNLDAALSGEEVDVNFNYRYISDSFQSIDSDSINLSFSGQNRAMVITAVGDRSFLYLVMPMNK